MLKTHMHTDPHTRLSLNPIITYPFAKAKAAHDHAQEKRLQSGALLSCGLHRSEYKFAYRVGYF